MLNASKKQKIVTGPTVLDAAERGLWVVTLAQLSSICKL